MQKNVILNLWLNLSYLELEPSLLLDETMGDAAPLAVDKGERSGAGDLKQKKYK